MKRRITFTAVLVALAVLSGCQTMSTKECVSADWRALGRRDATASGTNSALRRSESCAKNGFGADSNAYQIGFDEGMRLFCLPESGWRFARRGKTFGGTCPEDLEAAFRPAYRDGVRVHLAEKALNDAKAQESGLKYQLSEVEERIQEAQKIRRDARKTTSAADKNKTLDNIQRLRGELQKILDAMIVAQGTIPSLEAQVAALKVEIGNRWGDWKGY